MEVSEDGMQIFVAASDYEGTKICSRIVDGEKVNDSNCRGNFKDRVSARVD